MAQAKPNGKQRIRTIQLVQRQPSTVLSASGPPTTAPTQIPINIAAEKTVIASLRSSEVHDSVKDTITDMRELAAKTPPMNRQTRSIDEF